MANGKMVFLQSWYDAIMSDEYLETTEQEMAYILYAAMLYSFNGEINKKLMINYTIITH